MTQDLLRGIMSSACPCGPVIEVANGDGAAMFWLAGVLE